MYCVDVLWIVKFEHLYFILNECNLNHFKHVFDTAVLAQIVLLLYK